MSLVVPIARREQAGRAYFEGLEVASSRKLDVKTRLLKAIGDVVENEKLEATEATFFVFGGRGRENGSLVSASMERTAEVDRSSASGLTRSWIGVC